MSNELYPIVWDVIDIVDNRALLLSHYILDYKPYNETEDRPVWEQCSLRKWLNTEFYDTAFDSYEKMNIHTQDVDNSNLNCFDTDGGPADIIDEEEFSKADIWCLRAWSETSNMG